MVACLHADRKIGIVHLGLGAFFRAHGAIYIAEAMRASGGDWNILGVSLQSARTRDALARQDYVYTAVEQGPQGETPRSIDVVRGMLVAPENPEAVLAAMSQAQVKIVSLTVTEKGYCHEPATGRLNLTHPDIRHDIGNPLPKSAIGFIVRALQRRRLAGIRPFTVMTCDNLSLNGKLTRGVVLEFARQVDPGLAEWIEAEGRFPSSMVDRIVPATKPEDIERLAAVTGRLDRAPVFHEPFRQWVVEDDFVDSERPDLAAAGVQLVKDVTPWEHMKLRMLNGAHSSLAYLGYLSGHETIAQTMAEPALAGFVRKLWSQEIIPAIEPPPGQDLSQYADALYDRFANHGIRHRTWQIAMDGSQKLPQRLLSTLAENLDAGRDSPRLMLAVAAWIRYVSGVDEAGREIDVRDPMAQVLKERSAHGIAAVLGVGEIFPEDLRKRLEPGVSIAHARLLSVGARQAAGELA